MITRDDDALRLGDCRMISATMPILDGSRATYMRVPPSPGRRAAITGDCRGAAAAICRGAAARRCTASAEIDIEPKEESGRDCRGC